MTSCKEAKRQRGCFTLCNLPATCLAMPLRQELQTTLYLIKSPNKRKTWEVKVPQKAEIGIQFRERESYIICLNVSNEITPHMRIHSDLPHTLNWKSQM